MAPVVIENPILNSPYDEPTQHFQFDNSNAITDKIADGRRKSSYFVPIAAPKKKVKGLFDNLLADQKRTETDHVNRIRASVKLWRDRTRMRQMIERAGLVPWERTFQNLRSSFVIDLHERFPAHVASRWAGHTDKTALAHYLDVLDDHFDRASDRASGRDGAAESGAVALRNPAQPVAAVKCQEMPVPSEVFDRDSLSRSASSAVDSCPSIPVAPA